MKIYWSLKQVPELSGLTPGERLRVHRACYKNAFRDRRCKAALLVSLTICGLCGGAGAALGSSLDEMLGVPRSLWYVAICAGVGGGIGGFIHGQVVTNCLRPLYADYIRTELQTA